MSVAPLLLALGSLAAPPDAGAPVQSVQPRTGQDVLSARLPLYPGTRAPDRIGDVIEARGVPMNIQSFVTKDDPATVLAFYQKVFDDQDLPALGDGDLLLRFPYPSITAFDAANGVDLSVIAIRDPDHKLTTVLLALADMNGLHDNVERAMKDEFGGLPPYPLAEAPHTMKSTDSEQQRVLVSFATSDPADKVLAFYTAELGKQGFHVGPGSTADELAMVSGTGVWHVAVEPGPNQDKERTVVMATWSRPSEETRP